MNYYIVVEGVVEKNVYEYWVNYVSPQLKYVDHPGDMNVNNFSIVMGGGYPNYMDLISDAIIDISNSAIPTTLVCIVDSEDLSYEEKYTELDNWIKERAPQQLNYRLVIQHCCIEAWALGNRAIGPRNPKNEQLRKFKQHFDVFKDDPELLPAYDDLLRAQFAEIYLRNMLLDRAPGLSYSKKNPKILYQRHYFDELTNRSNAGHIKTFDVLSSVFMVGA